MNEQKFQEELIANYEKASLLGINSKNIIQTIVTRGGVSAVKDLIRRQIVSDGFEALQKTGNIKLTLEACVVKSEYADLFTDDEVNYCFDILCEYGYFG